MLKPRVVKSIGCPRCKIYLKALTRQGYEYLVYDADVKENQKELDGWKINMMPVVQIVDVKDNGTQEMVFQFAPGQWSSRHIDAKIKVLNKEREKKK